MFKNTFKIRTNKKSGQAKRKPRHWILSVTAVGVLVAYTIGSSRALNVAHVKENRGEIARRFADEKSLVRHFNIPAGTLSEVLTAFEKATGWRVSIPDNVRGIDSEGVSGDYTEEEALKRILQNTGVAYTIISPQNVLLKIAGVAAVVEVVDENSALSSPKYTAPLRDIPQTITVIGKETIQEQGATTLRDVLKNVPGLTVAAGEGGTPAGDNLTLRGFSARNDIYIDGARDLGPQTRDSFNLEQVEVVKGPSSSFTGRGSTGGTINLTSKTPGFKPSYNFDVSGGTDKTKRVTGDVNLPLERLGLNERAAFRLNFMAHDSNVAGREVIGSDRRGIAPTLTLGAGNNTSLTFGFFHLRQNNISDYGIPWVPNTNNVLAAYRDRPAPVPRSTFYGLVNRDNEKLRADLGTFTLNHAFSDRLNLRNQFRYGRSTRDSNATPPRFGNNDSTVITRELRAWITTDETYDNQTDLTRRFDTGRFEHAFVAGAEFIRERNVRHLRSAPNAATTLYNPNPYDAYTGIFTVSPFVGDVTANTQSVYAFDTIKLLKKLDVSGGFRFDRFDARGVSAATTGLTPLARVDNLLSYRLAANYKPVQIASLYVSYGTALNPSLEGLSYSVSSASVEPEKTYTLEAGTKWDLFKNRLLLTGAIFRVAKDNARTPGLPGEPAIVLDGRQRVDGIEFGATGNLTRNWNLFAGYALLDSRIVKSNAAPTIVSGVGISEVGKRLINTPRNSFNLWSTYQLPFRLNIGGAARFAGRRYGNAINTRFVDSYWTFDATASYPLNKHMDLRLNLYNLTDKYYFDRITGGQVVPGAARSVLFSTNVHF